EHQHQQKALVADIGDTFVVSEEVALESEQAWMVGMAPRQRTILELRRLQHRKMLVDEAHGIIVADRERRGALEPLVGVQKIVPGVSALIDPKALPLRHPCCHVPSCLSVAVEGSKAILVFGLGHRPLSAYRH